MSHGGKWSAPRPFSVPHSDFAANFDRIFKQQEPELEMSDSKNDTDDDEWTCTSCGGPMYRQPHWSYGQCDDCGRRKELEPDEP